MEGQREQTSHLTGRPRRARSHPCSQTRPGSWSAGSGGQQAHPSLGPAAVEDTGPETVGPSTRRGTRCVSNRPVHEGSHDHD